MKKTYAILICAGFLSCSGAATRPTAEAVDSAYAELWARFVSPQGLLYDYVGELPTPEDCAACRPNAMGWWSPIENGPMFTGPFLWAMVQRARRTGRAEDREKCRRLVEGLILCADVCGTPGMICRGVGSDGRCHYPLGSCDQTVPWFFGMDAYLRGGFGAAALRERVRAKMVAVAAALEKTGWRLPCDGAFAQEFRGNLVSDALPFRGATHYLFILRALADATGEAKWRRAYRAARDERYPGPGKNADPYAETRLEVCAYGYRYDREKSRHPFQMEPLQFWIYVCAHQALAELAVREEEPRAARLYREGLVKGAKWAAPFVEDYRKWDNRAERPFGYANWRRGWRWREQKTQADAAQVAKASVPEVLGTRKQYERRYLTSPLAAAAICAFDAAYRPAVERALRFYDYTTPNISEFFFAAVAYEVLNAAWIR